MVPIMHQVKVVALAVVVAVVLLLIVLEVAVFLVKEITAVLLITMREIQVAVAVLEQQGKTHLLELSKQQAEQD
jgi:hypothetical protein